MGYRIEFFNEAVEAEVMEWPGGILASFTRIAERITEHGPNLGMPYTCLLYTSPSPRDRTRSRMPSSA